jgi:hypothetical protein
VTKNQKAWLAAMPWDSVTTLNNALCQAQKLEPLNNAITHDRARSLWNKSVAKVLTIGDALETCRDCQELSPFTFNNGNTFAAIGRTLIEDYLKQMPPVEAQIIRTTVCHYIAGLVSEKELRQVLKHFEKLLDTLPAAAAAANQAMPSREQVGATREAQAAS